jgi:thiamine pyrophosphokinase
MDKIVYIVTGGPMKDLAFLRQKLDTAGEIDLICADGGARHLHALGVVPKAIIGDMDSLPSLLQSDFATKGTEIISYPTRKNETDTQLALEYAFTLNSKTIWIFGALGGRIDHALANLSLLVLGTKKGIETKLIDSWCEVFVINKDRIIEGEAGQTISLLPVSTVVTGITLSGFEYPLTDGIMEIGKPYGISNRLVDPRGIISIASGYLLVIHYFKAGGFPEGD